MSNAGGSLPFIGRTQELAALNEAYKSPRSAFWPIYGRRRVGKSELIRRFSQPHPTVYVVGTRGTPGQQLIREFLEIAAVTVGEPLLATSTVSGWKKAIELALSRYSQDRKLILVFDEFQWIAEKSPEITSVLQELWDRSWQRNGRIFLILCGSYIGFMEREVLGKQSPLFGRRTGQIFLKPFGYSEAALFFPGASLIQKAASYFICGGIPLYLRYFEPARSILQNIEHLLLSNSAPLYEEPNFLLREALREVEKYYMILRSLAEGPLPSRDIARRSDIAERSVHYYLEQLESLGYLGKHFPLTTDKPKARDIRYRLLDPLLRFWFHFIFPHSSQIALAGAQKAAVQLIEPKLDAYFGTCFESLCREALPVIYERERVSALFEVGSYWSRQCQIDVVGLRDDGWTDLGECRWGANASVTTAVADLEAKIRHYPNTRQATIGRRIFLRTFKPGRGSLPQHVKVHTLADLYGE